MRSSLPALLATCAVALALPAGASAFGPVSSFGSGGSGAGQMNAPGGIAIAADGTAYVADFGNNRIDVFSPTGAVLFAFGKEVNATDKSNVCTSASGCVAGGKADTAGAMDSPESVEVAPDGNLYVVDSGNNRIDVFSPQGAFLFAFGKGVNATNESGVCTAGSGCKAGAADGSAGDIFDPKGATFGADGNLYVADTDNDRISVFSPAGAFLFAFGEEVNLADESDVCTATSGCKAANEGAGAGELDEPFDVDVGPDGRLAVSDSGNDRVSVFSDKGRFLLAFGKEVNPDKSGICTPLSGCEPGVDDASAGSLGGPTAIDVEAGAVYVADERNNRISQFTFAGAFVRAFGEGVIDGGAAFQICDLGTGCERGIGGAIPGSIASPFGVAVDCRGAIYAVELGPEDNRVERFAEPGTAAPPCRPPAVVPVKAAAPSNRFEFGKLKLNKAKGTATLVVAVPGAGALALNGRGIRKVERSLAKAGNVTLSVKLAGKAKRKLVKTGRSKVTAKLTFTPTGGAALTQPRSLTLKKTLQHRAPRGLK